MKLTIFEYIARAVPESYIMLYSLLSLCNIKTNSKKFIFSGILMSLFQYTVRLFPINYGVHTILGIFFIIILMNNLYKVDMIKCIKCSLLVVLLLFICEFLNLTLLNLIFDERLELIMLNKAYKTFLGIPSLLGLLALINCWKLRKRNVENK